MSFTGIFKAKDGLVALADSKGSIEMNGKLREDPSRNPQKLFAFPNGVAVTYGANQILVQNPNQIFTGKVLIEDLVNEYLAKHHTLDSNFFQSVLIKMGTNPSNKKEPVQFIVGRKIWAGEYRIEFHRIGYDYYVEKIGSNTDYCFTGGNELYKQAFDQFEFISCATSADILRKYVAGKLQQLIDMYDEILPYNSVGGSVKSYILR
ncbi:MAG: hypothetical protein Q4D45_03435 [Lachnospiraceae bacterium]|nr:hypothetical protein [Lachnospiraceae bacterium]